MILERDKICLGQQLVSVRSERDRKDLVPIRMSLRVLPERRDVSAPIGPGDHHLWINEHDCCRVPGLVHRDWRRHFALRRFTAEEH
jgi:hypothetical protein